MSKLNWPLKFSWPCAMGMVAIIATLSGCTALPTTVDVNEPISNQASTTTSSPQGGEEQTIEGINFVYVPAGPFIMGSTDEEVDYALQLCEQYWDAPMDRETCERSWFEDEQPQSTDISIGAFWIMQYEVTTAQFRGFVEGDGYTNDAYWTDAGWAWKTENSIESPLFWGDPALSGSNLPVEGISWYEAFAFAAWLSAQTDSEFRLPTEAEWEKAARGTDGRRFPWGDEWEPERIHYCDVSDTKAESDERNYECATLLDPVGTFDNASPYNAYDMTGNVWEWTSSRGFDYPYEADERESPDGDHDRVLRSGNWLLNPNLERAAGRYIAEPDRQLTGRGMRLVISTK